MEEMPITINPPFYLAKSEIKCWKCNGQMPVVAIIVSSIMECPDDKEPGILSEIELLPHDILSIIQKKFPDFKKKHSKTMECDYYMNCCPKCGMHSGDFYLMSEPGGAFFPTSDREIEKIKLEKLELNKPLKVISNYGIGPASNILEYYGLIKSDNP